MTEANMRSHCVRLSGVLVVVGTILMAGADLTGAETVNCTVIKAVPTIVTAPGVYCLAKNLTTNIAAGNAIEIIVGNVILDLNGHRLDGTAGLNTLASGVFAREKDNITIKNGIVAGFLRGIDLGNTSHGYLVEEIRAEGNTLAGIQVVGVGLVIRNNQVVATGNSTQAGPTGGNAQGIVASGSSARVINNDVIDVQTQLGGTTWGILFSSAPDALALNNRISQADKGIDFSASTGKYRDNLTTDVPTPFTGGTAVGVND